VLVQGLGTGVRDEANCRQPLVSASQSKYSQTALIVDEAGLLNARDGWLLKRAREEVFDCIGRDHRQNSAVEAGSSL